MREAARSSSEPPTPPPPADHESSSSAPRWARSLSALVPDVSAEVPPPTATSAPATCEGEGVAAEAVLPGHVVRSVLKAEPARLAEVNTYKNLVGSALAGSRGGFNAHASNSVTAVFLACGQDPAPQAGWNTLETFTFGTPGIWRVHPASSSLPSKLVVGFKAWK